jgi:hypothetical protein
LRPLFEARVEKLAKTRLGVLHLPGSHSSPLKQNTII